PLLSRGERADPGRDGGPRGRRGDLSAGTTPPGDTGAGHGAGRAGSAYRPPAAGGEAPPANGCRGGYGGALAPVAGHRRAARRGAAWEPLSSPGRRVPLRRSEEHTSELQSR